MNSFQKSIAAAAGLLGIKVDSYYTTRAIKDFVIQLSIFLRLIPTNLHQVIYVEENYQTKKGGGYE